MIDTMIQQAILAQDGAQPRYQALALALQGLVAAGKIAPGTRLPPERELSVLSGLSRVTIRKAVNMLASKGILVQRQGSGTYVAQVLPTPQDAVLPILSLTEDLRQRGQAGRSVWLARQTGPGCARDCSALGLPEGTQIVRLTRLRISVPSMSARAMLKCLGSFPPLPRSGSRGEGTMWPGASSR